MTGHEGRRIYSIQLTSRVEQLARQVMQRQQRIVRPFRRKDMTDLMALHPTLTRNNPNKKLGRGSRMVILG